MLLLLEEELDMEMCLLIVIGLRGRFNVKNINYLVFLIVYFCTEYIIVITWFSNGPERKTDKAVGRTFCPVA